MNSVIMIGRLTHDPEVRYTAGNESKAVASYSIAVQRDYKNSEGNYDSDFFRCKCFGKTAEFVEKYLHKGTKIAITGKLQSGSYEKDGVKHYTTDILVNSHEFCEKRGEGAPAQETPTGFTEVDEDLPF